MLFIHTFYCGKLPIFFKVLWHFLFRATLIYEDLVYLTVEFTFKLLSFKLAFFITKLNIYNIIPSAKCLGIDLSYDFVI